MNFADSTLWRAGFEPAGDPNDAARALSDALHGMRQLAGLLVGEISADLRKYTVHDLTHLDALWGVASEIAGPEYFLTPPEAFVLGGAILLHDAGMTLAAYPGGLPELQAHPRWASIARRFPGDLSSGATHELDLAVTEFLRLEHANRAKDLARLEWRGSDGTHRTLIESGDLRQKFGEFIGEVAASHWWSHDKVSERLNRIIPAPPPYPTAWSIDLLKVAALLRVADAAHIDERRAPGFLWALRSRTLDDISSLHWLFQNRLTQPPRRGDAIHYAATSEFKKEDAEAWWLAYDALKMIDDELRKTDVLLADLRGDPFRFAAKRVANAETALTLVRSIKVAGWIPIDTSIQVKDVPALVKSLGGEALYGRNPMVPLRELVQNGVDAIQHRNAVQPRPGSGQLMIEINQIDGSWFLEVTDNGIGMTPEIIKSSLLDFGGSGWANDPIFSDYPTASTRKVRAIGKFGALFEKRTKRCHAPGERCLINRQSSTVAAVSRIES